jgi:uncharacterized membrane protein
VFLLESKYLHLGYYDWDLAFFTQACWQLLHGSQYVSLVGINYFGDHSYFLSLATLPFFAIAPSPMTLVFLKVIAFVVSAFLFYKIAYPQLGQAKALVLMLLYLLFPANIFSILYEFNPESFAPPILFWMFMSFEAKNWKSFFLADCLCFWYLCSFKQKQSAKDCMGDVIIRFACILYFSFLYNPAFSSIVAPCFCCSLCLLRK